MYNCLILHQSGGIHEIFTLKLCLHTAQPFLLVCSSPPDPLWMLKRVGLFLRSCQLFKCTFTLIFDDGQTAAGRSRGSSSQPPSPVCICKLWELFKDHLKIEIIKWKCCTLNTFWGCALIFHNAMPTQADCQTKQEMLHHCSLSSYRHTCRTQI